MVKLPLRRRISAKSQVAIPIVLLKQFHLQPHGEVIFEPVKDGILLRLAEDPIARGLGMLKGLGSSEEIMKSIRQEEKEYERKKLRKLGL